VPVGIYFYFVLLVVNFRLSKMYDTKVVLTKDNYDDLYDAYQQLSKDLHILSEGRDICKEDWPWCERPLFKQLNKAVNRILDYHAFLDDTIKCLDQPLFPLPKGMKVITPDQLAKGRVSGYQYLV